jgi:hypothetical protein
VRCEDQHGGTKEPLQEDIKKKRKEKAGMLWWWW